MAASNLYVNWSPVTITMTSPTSGSTITITEVTSVNVMIDGEQIKFLGDALKFPRGIKNVALKRGIEIKTGNPGQLLGAVNQSSVYTIVATLQDMNNGTGTGALTITLVSAVLAKAPVSGDNNQFGNGTISFESFGASSDTDPLSFAVAS